MGRIHMNFKKKLLLLATSALAMLTLSACSKNSSSTDGKVATNITKKTTVVFWHSMTGASEKCMKQYAAEFEKKHPNIHIKLENQGNYADLQSKINATLQSPKNLPTITQAYPGWLYDAAKLNKLVNLKPYIENSQIGWGSVAKSDIKDKLLLGAQIGGKQYGIPFNKSSEVLFYNKDVFDKYNLKVPRNMSELAQCAKTIYKKSNHALVGAGVDELANYYILSMKEQGIDFDKNIDMTCPESKKALNWYIKGLKEGYLQIASANGYLSTDFGHQKVAMFISTCASEAYVKMGMGKNKFNYGVAPRPSKYNVQQGTDIYMFNKGTAEQKSAAFMFIKFMLSKRNQLKLAHATGYMPVLNSILKSDDYKCSKDSKVAGILDKTTANIYNLQISKNENAAYFQLKSSMQAILLAAKKGDSVVPVIKANQLKLAHCWKQ